MFGDSAIVDLSVHTLKLGAYQDTLFTRLRASTSRQHKGREWWKGRGMEGGSRGVHVQRIEIEIGEKIFSCHPFSLAEHII